MALRVAGTTSHVTGASPSGFGSDADGTTLFVWMRRNVAGDIPRAGLIGTGASRLIANNNSGALRGIITDTAPSNLLPTVTGSGALGLWTPLAISVRDLAGTRSAVAVSASAIGTPATSSTFALGPALLNAFVLGREASAATAFTGDYAHLAVWDGALGTGEMQALCRGASPLSISRGLLQAYFPLERDFRNLANPAFFLVPNTAPETWVDSPQGVTPPARRPFLVYVASSVGATAVAGAGDCTIGIRGDAVGAVRIAGTADGTLGIGVASAGAAAVSGTAAGTLGLSASAAGVVGAGPVTATGGGSIGLSLAAFGAVRIVGATSGMLGLSIAAAAAARVAGQAAAVLPLSVNGLGLVQSTGSMPAVQAALSATRPARGVVSVMAVIEAELQIEGSKGVQRYIVGEEVQVSLLFTAPDGAPIANATGVAIRAQPPGGGAARGYAVSAGTIAGQWVATVLLDTAGRWHISGECAGPTRAVDELTVTVAARSVPPA